MQILRKYQLDIIFFFLVLITLISLVLYGLKHLNSDPHLYEWVISGPLILLFVVWLIKIRSKIQLSERRRLTGKTLFYWIALGITIFMSTSSPIPARDYGSIKLFFI
ncbi:MAG: hypothetical protein Q7S24_01020, partial [bacterium]|nr:hypothetical protein [bacterium]